MRRALALLLCSLAAALVVADPASGSCIGPQVSVEPATVVRNAPIVISGLGWGDGSCFDTGAPPDSHGELGKPGAGIVVEVRQGDQTVQLARLDANADYSFRVGATVPNDLVDGQAVVIARIAAPDGWRTAQSSLFVRAASAGVGADSEAATIVDRPPRNDTATLVMVLAAAGSAMAATVFVQRYRRSRVRG